MIRNHKVDALSARDLLNCHPHVAVWPCTGGVAGSSPGDAYDLTLGVAQRLETGGLVKARVKHTGQLSLLYEQAVSGLGRVAFTCSLDPLKLNKVAPSVGLALTL